MFFSNQVTDVRNSPRTMRAVLNLMDKWANLPVDSKGRVLGRVRKPNKHNGMVISFQHVYFASHLGWHVRIGLPADLKFFSGSRYGASEDQVPNGFEYVGFETMEQACEKVRAIRTLAVNEDYDGFFAWISTGDGTTRFFDKKTGKHYRSPKAYASSFMTA